MRRGTEQLTDREHDILDAIWDRMFKACRETKQTGYLLKVSPYPHNQFYVQKGARKRKEHCRNSSFFMLLSYCEVLNISIDYVLLGSGSPTVAGDDEDARSGVRHILATLDENDLEGRILALLPFLTQAQQEAIEAVVRSCL